MNEYEVLLLLDPDVSEDRQNEIVARIRETVERSGGTWDRHDVWGRRKLAYEIAHKPEGFYHLLLFSSCARRRWTRSRASCGSRTASCATWRRAA